jgi:hypothetical protein
MAIMFGVTAVIFAVGLDSSLARAEEGQSLASTAPVQVGTANDSLIALLTLMMAVVAGLGVLNTVLLGTRDRVHDLGVFKAVGMTPRQTIVMVLGWVAGPAVAAAVIAGQLPDRVPACRARPAGAVSAGHRRGRSAAAGYLGGPVRDRRGAAGRVTSGCGSAGRPSRPPG